MLRKSSSGGGGLPTYGSSGGGYSSGGANYGGYNHSNDMMYGGYSNDTSSNDKYQKRKAANPSLPYVISNLVFVILALLFTFLWLRSSSQHASILKTFQVDSNQGLQSLMRELRKDLAQTSNMIQNRKTIEKKYAPKIASLEKENRFLQKERDELRVKYEGPDKKEEEERRKQREIAYTEQVELMQKHIQRESKRTVLERYVM